MRLRRFQTAFVSTVTCRSKRRESTLQKNDPSSRGVPRVSRAWGQTNSVQALPPSPFVTA